MAGRTVLRELIAGMVGIHRGIVVSLMTLNAVRVREIVIPVHMAILAWLRRMRALQRKRGIVVIKRRWLPCVDRVAG